MPAHLQASTTWITIIVSIEQYPNAYIKTWQLSQTSNLFWFLQKSTTDSLPCDSEKAGDKSQLAKIIKAIAFRQVPGLVYLGKTTNHLIQKKSRYGSLELCTPSRGYWQRNTIYVSVWSHTSFYNTCFCCQLQHRRSQESVRPHCGHCQTKAVT